MTDSMDPREPDGLPPDLPPEYAEAYRRGYRRAWASPADPEPLVEPSIEDRLFGDVEAEPWTAPTHRDPEAVPERPGWLVPALLGALVLALVLGAYGLGKLFSGSVGSGHAPADERLQMPSDSPRHSQAAKPVTGRPWDGDVSPVSVARASSGCVLPPGRDAAGRRVDYGPDQTHDGDFTTAWRCAGSGRGVTLRLVLGRSMRLGEVGLVPGYAKTDPQSHADRYAENNRLTRIRWTFSDGRSVVQTVDGSPTNRALQTMRIPPVRTDVVTLEVLASASGPRNTIAVSEIELSETVG